MSSTQLEDEEALVKARVLAHEARPYNRLVKRCSSITNPDTPLTPDAAARLRDEIDVDFKYFESVITRIQLLKDTNRREVERYEKEKGDILETASTARSTLISLRATLQTTQNEKANKLHYDTIATDILRTGGLKARDEQTVNLDRLHKEISALEREREDYRAVWAARRTQFGQIVDQLEKMWAQIKEDKDEQDRREGMSEEEEGEEVEGAVAPGAGAGVGAAGLKVVGGGGGEGVGGDAATPAGMTPSVGVGAEEEEEEMEEGEESEEGVGAEGDVEVGDVEVGDVDMATQREEEREEGEREEGEEEEEGEEGEEEEGEEGEKMVVEEVEEVDKMDIE
ncbi:Tho complex subunit 7-domain-containing protein [Morchella snyderi]|nr:Tho complex subunit 7-domain-containing protein [Morchella snyderi]